MTAKEIRETGGGETWRGGGRIKGVGGGRGQGKGGKAGKYGMRVRMKNDERLRTSAVLYCRQAKEQKITSRNQSPCSALVVGFPL